MRHRRAALAVAAFTLLGVAACGDDPDEKESPSSVPTGASAGAPAPGASTGTSAAPGTPADPSATPTEGTASKKPPKKGGEPNQGPVGRGGSADVLSAAGLGPYSIGIKQRELKSAALVKGATTKQKCTTAKGLADHAAPTLAFSGGELQRIAVTSADVSTTTGAKVGTSYADVKSMYPAGKQLDDWVGASAWYTVEGGNALLFRIKDGKVAAIEAGPSQTLQFHYTDKQGC